MSAISFDELDQLASSEDAATVVDRLIASLEEQKEYHRLFDALLLKIKVEMGLPLAESSDDIPEAQQEEFETKYIDAARRIGKTFLDAGNIPQAWIYLRTIHEPEPVREALDALDPELEPSESTDELINLALYEGVHAVKGLEILLRVNGTCNTVTALDQQIQQMRPEDRRGSAKLLVNELYQDLVATLRSEVEQKLAGVELPETLRELMAGRDWLFEDGNYHIDVSHLNAVVRFARFLSPGDADLGKATELAEYGTKLSPQFQYPGDPPFDEFYPAHVQFFKVLADDDQDEGLAFFRKQIEEEPDDDDKPMLAFVVVDLLKRIGRIDDALELATKYLKGVEDPPGFSYSDLCREAGRLDLLRESARASGDVVTYAATLLQK